MYKILFRGMTKDGDWIEGSLFTVETRSFISGESSDYSDDYHNVTNWREVTSNTIGQYIGIKEDYKQNGKMIFIGDKVEMVFVDEDSGGRITFIEKAVVTFDERTKQVGFQSNKYYKGFAPIGHYTDNCNAESIRVTGTIFDQKVA